MKVDKSTRETLIENFEAWHKRLEERYKLFTEILKDAEEVEDLMSAKKDLLLWIVEDLPIVSDTCYFCLAFDCENCPYAKTHGECFLVLSDWQSIKDARSELRDKLYNYYKGESYVIE